MTCDESNESLLLARYILYVGQLWKWYMCFFKCCVFQTSLLMWNCSGLGCNTNLRKKWKTIYVQLMFSYWCKAGWVEMKVSSTKQFERVAQVTSNFSCSILCLALDLCGDLDTIADYGMSSSISSSLHHPDARGDTFITMVTSVTSDHLPPDPRVTMNFSKKDLQLFSPPSTHWGFTLVGLANDDDGCSD